MNDERNGENGFEPEEMEPKDEHTEGDFEADDEHTEEDLERGDEHDEDDFEPDDEHDERGPEPATFAGRQQWGGLPSSGLTEEFNEVERQMAEGVDDDSDDDAEHAGDDEKEDIDEGEFAGEFASPVAEEPGADRPDDDEVESAEAEDEGSDEPEEDEEEAADEDEAAPADEEEAADEDEEAPAGEEAPANGGDESGKTVEADTPVLADQEEAREKAMAGLRARAQEGQAKRRVPEPHTSGGEDATEVAEAPAEPAKAPAVPAAPPVAVAVADAEQPANQQKAPKSWLWARFVTASFLIIVSMATATSVSLLVYLTDIAKGLGGLEGLRGQLDSVDEDAQNFLILGSDVRPDEAGHGRSDTTMLVRVDPDVGVISQLSIPRDLRVSIPGHGAPYKFNEAYSYGGPKLTLKTLNALTDDRIDVDHVVNVDFNGFADAVDAIGCVYIDVDRHYFVSPEADYAEIDIEAGYQRLCGLKALQYVRFRHEDNDLVRSARQQGFLREARSQVPPGKLLDQRNKLINIFTQYTTSDINQPSTLVTLFKLMLDARNAQINQVRFPTISLDEGGYVTASSEGVRAAVDEFLSGGQPSSEESESSGEKKAGKGGGKSGGENSKEEQKPEEPPPPPPMIDSTALGQSLSATMAQDAGSEIKFPIAYPTRVVPNSTISDTQTRWFRIDGPGDEIYRGYKFVISEPTDNGIEYYGVSGTNWLDAPLFKNASEEREINGRDYRLYYDSGQLRMVAFEKGKAMYWVTNTLDKALDNAQMLELAKFIAVPDG
jgi:polyisoprenyl-teichoic acid--peptidoglycan teichoic acid transferase